MRFSFRWLCFVVLSAATSSCAQSQPALSQSATAAKPGTLPLRVLIVSGGPSPDYNQYAIESNARYVEKLTARAISHRVLFADGHKQSRTIGAVQNSPLQTRERVFAWLFDLEEPTQRISYRASTLRRIDGPSTQKAIIEGVQKLSREAKPGEKSLLYFTGHGAPGQKSRLSLRGLTKEDDFENTTYALWNDGELDVKTLAKALEKWPADAPLVLVMVQCHAGGFANLLFQNADPANPVLNRNFCGFFAATGERQASGCTSEVDEVNYQDFTTHFFAALSGISRDGRRISGADFDKNGQVSMLEALAWTNLHDDSIDVPLCTSDAFLRSIWPTPVAPEWIRTPYSRLLQSAAPWQRATLEGLAGTLNLRGENRIQDALALRLSATKAMDDQDPDFPVSMNADAVWKRFSRLKNTLQTRFPALKTSHQSADFQSARRGALRYLQTQTDDVKQLSHALEAWTAQSESVATREAQCERFIRAARTIFLEEKLKAEGSAAQKLIFSRLRGAENRNPLH